MNLHVGTMGWSYDFWKGNFYPEDLASNAFLSHYAEHFNTVEVDSTFYRIPRAQNVINWKEQTPDHFVFSLKFPRIITHVKRLKDCDEESSIFLKRAGLLGEKLGPLLLQFSSSFGNQQVTLLADFLKKLPKKYRYVVEVRNRRLLNDSFYSALRERNVVLAWVDSPFLPQINEVTSDFLYMRWEGERRSVKGTLGRIEVDRKAKTKLWADKIKPFLESQNDFFGYFSKFYSGHPPSDVKDFLSNIIKK